MRSIALCCLTLSAAGLILAQTAPTVISRADPEYSDEARLARVQSQVVLDITVGEDGKARDIQVANGAGFGLDERAIEAVKAWVFRPGAKEGNPVAMKAKVELNFRLLVKDPEDHSDQIARLNFTLPAGTLRPQLTVGKLPGNPVSAGDQLLRFHLWIDANGVPEDVTVLSSTDHAWEQLTERVVKTWRFRPASVNGSAVAVEGVFELAHSEPPMPALPLSMPVVSATVPDASVIPIAPAVVARPVTGLQSRVNNTATLLNNGTVLLAGGAAHLSEMEPGSADFRDIASAQIFDFATRRIVNTGDMITARANQTATLLQDGTVLIAGGGTDHALSTAEIYDPSTGKFLTTGSLHTARTRQGAALLPNGDVLICGGTGIGNKNLASAEIYDPRMKLFTIAGNMTTARTSFRAVTLKDGRILLIGGFGAAGGTAETYDPVRNTFQATGNMTLVRFGFSATVLKSGEVLIAGGSRSPNQGPALASAEVYDPVAGSFHATGLMSEPREFHTALLLGNGKVLVAGGLPASPGSPLTATEIYDPASGSFSSGPQLSGRHTGHTATLLQDGNVLVAGSGLIGFTNSAELLLNISR
jgi:TonB family protein